MSAAVLRNLSNFLFREIIHSIMPLLLVIIPISVIFFLMHFLLGNHFVGVLTRDPNDDLGMPFYVGAISMFGIALWFGCLLIILLAIVLLSDRAKDDRRGFLVAFGSLTFALALDDMLQIHEEVFPKYFYIDEVFVYIFYVILLLFILFRYWKILLHNEPFIIMVALFFFFCSISADVILPKMPFFWRFAVYAVEDGAKLIGIVLWVTYFFRFTLREARDRRSLRTEVVEG